MRTMIGLLLISVTLGACATLTYEGAGDIRIGSIIAGNHARFQPKFERSSAENAVSAFKPHDPISIYLKNAFFAWCPPHPIERAVAQLGNRIPKCRIAIVVNVGSKLEQNLDPASSSSPGRIVFYSRDIQKEQFVNQSYGPVYSNSSWDGNDLTVDVTILEMRQEDNARTEAILKVLASLGTSSMLSAGGQQLLGALNRVGGAFVQASAHDSVIGYYRFTAVNRNSGSEVYVPILQEGDLVLVRAKDDSRETIDWKNYIYDPSVGKLFQRIDASPTSDTYHLAHLCNKSDLRQADMERVTGLDPRPGPSICYIESHYRNYLVFSFVRSASAGDWVPTTTLSALQTAIQSSGSATALKQAVGSITDAVLQRGKFLGARDAIQKLKDPAVSAAVKTYEADKVAEAMQCGYLNSLGARSASGTTLGAYAQANCGGGNWTTISLASNEFEYLVQQILGCKGISIAEQTLVGAPADGSNALPARAALAASIAKCQQ